MRAAMESKKLNAAGSQAFLPTAYCLLPAVLCLLLTVGLSAGAFAQTATPRTQATDFQSVIARQASLVSEFDVNGLKVLVKTCHSTDPPYSSPTISSADQT